MRPKYYQPEFKHERLYDSPRWRKVAKMFLDQNPLCNPCWKISGREVPASIVHHKIEHKGDEALFWNWDNLEAVCPSCHSGHIRVSEHVGYSQACDADGFPIDPRHPANKIRG
jgi:5-methylcytosine-specific restriction protein A